MSIYDQIGETFGLGGLAIIIACCIFLLLAIAIGACIRQESEKPTETIDSYLVENSISIKPAYKVIQNFSSKYDERIRELYRYDKEFTQTLLKSALTRLLHDDPHVTGFIQTNDAMDNLLTKCDESNVISGINDYLSGIKSRLYSWSAFYNVPTGEIETPTRILHGTIDLMTSDKIVLIVCQPPSQSGRNIYDDYYAKLYIQSLYSNKCVRSYKRMKLCVLNLLTNEFVTYARAPLQLK